MVKAFESVQKLCLRVDGSGETHLPEQSNKDRILSSVVDDVSGDVYAAMQDVNIVPKNVTMAFLWAWWRSHMNVDIVGKTAL